MRVQRSGDRRGRGARTGPPPLAGSGAGTGQHPPAGRRGGGRLPGSGCGLGVAAAAAIRVRQPGRCSTRWPGSARCSATSTTRAVEEIWINEPGRVFVARQRPSELTNVDPDPRRGGRPGGADAEAVRAPARSVAPFVDAHVARRLPAACGDPGHHPGAHGRQHPQIRGLRPSGLDELVRLGSLTEHAARFLEAAVVAGLNIIVTGGTQAGKTTLLNSAVHLDPGPRAGDHRRGGLRAAAAAARRGGHADPAAEPGGAGEIPLRRLVKEALRMRPSRMIVGEVRQEECLDLLIALNSGLPGMCTLHANSRPRGGGEDVHAAAAGRRERQRRRSWCRRSRLRRPGRAARHRSRRPPPGPRDRRAAGPGRGRRDRDRRHLHQRGRPAGPGRRLSAARGPRYAQPASTSPRCSDRTDGSWAR